eukprot:TRINITY_DN71879_c0_g1_i1.p2 TRINITY_DN71879_c0_g1~~TRINITY_DN71879_c0_g1_i1.p2  ORF type:complete len:128 (+),score=43.38 TRINITY_DN71879_c0_g1_i1:41-424(+)
MALIVGVLVSAVLLTGKAAVVADEQLKVLSEEARDAEDMEIFEHTFYVSDTNKDGALSREEAVAMAKAENPQAAERVSFLSDVNAEFDEFDADKSGSLSQAEFVELLRSAQEEADEHDEGEDDSRDD